MGKVFRRALATAMLSAVVGFFACREPTQITLTITSDAGCPEDDQRPRLNDVLVISGRAVQLGNGDLVANAQTTLCSFAEPNLVGTLVFLPDGKDDPSVEVLVVAGVQRDETDDQESMSAGSCLAVVNDPDASKRSIEGLPCIVARRRLTFVAHNSLSLPINLDRRCIGQECGADLTCFEGNCVNPNLTCTDGGGCTEPKGCESNCDDGCMSRNGTCVEGVCQCEPCEPALCTKGTCVDGQCLCAPTGGVCSPETCASGECACGPEQSSTCVGEQCGCACDEDKCAKHCADIGKINPRCSDEVDSIACLCDDPMGQGGAGPGGAGPGGAGHGGAGHGGNGGAGQGGNGTTSSSTTTTTTTTSTSTGGTCDPADCMGPCGEGVFKECTSPTSCSCTCHQTSCNSYCQTLGVMFAGACSTEPFGACNCYMISGTGTGGMVCPPATAPDCTMCDTACDALMQGCSGGACADVTGGNTSVSCMCH